MGNQIPEGGSERVVCLFFEVFFDLTKSNPDSQAIHSYDMTTDGLVSKQSTAEIAFDSASGCRYKPGCIMGYPHSSVMQT